LLFSGRAGHFAFLMPSVTAQRLSFEIGRFSVIHTMSPTENSFFSSCAWYFFDRRTVFFIIGWVKRRSTRTTTVLSCLSLTTIPWSMRFGIVVPLNLTLRAGALLLRHGLDPRDVAPHLPHARGVLELT